MNSSKRLLVAAAMVATCVAIEVVPGVGLASLPAPITASAFPVAATARDGRSDFNFEFGTWRTHYRILKGRLTGSHEWEDCFGTSVVRPFWNGSGNLEDGDLKCPSRYVGGMTLRTYDAKSHQWTLWWGTRALGISPPQQIGHFEANGTGNFYAYDSWKGTPVIVRFRWTAVNGNPHFAQAFSADHGKRWETNWTTDYERVAPSSKGVWNAPGLGGTDRGFDFLLGTWKTHYRRLRHLFSNSHDWYDCSGNSVVRAFWGGGADIEEGDLRCPMRHIQGLTVRLFDAGRRRWMLYWGTQASGLALGLPQVGSFNTLGIGEFFAPDTFDGKPIVVRYRWEPRSGNPHFEQAFSADNGKTWETNWTTDYSRM